MTPRSWMAHSRTQVEGLPPTLPGLVAALAISEHTATTFALSTAPGITHGAAHAALLCQMAHRCVARPDARRPAPGSVPMAPPSDPRDPAHTRDLDALLRECIEVAVEVLDNDAEVLDLDEVKSISSAVSLLDRARTHCAGPRS